MQNATRKRRRPAVEKNHNLGTAKPGHTGGSGSLAGFLIDTDLKAFVFLGRCVQHFGFGAVAGFLLGAACVYGYAFFKPLPYAVTAATESKIQPSPTPPAPSKTVQLHGWVRDAAGEPIKEAFTVGVLANQLGPVQNAGGSFALEVPRSNSYDVAVWVDAETARFYRGFAAEPDGDGYKLQQALPFLRVNRGASIQSSRSRGTTLQSQSGER
jgi:hypothetical protein